MIMTHRPESPDVSTFTSMMSTLLPPLEVLDSIFARSLLLQIIFFHPFSVLNSCADTKMQQKTIFCQSKDSLSWLLAANYTRQAQTKDTSATPQTELKDPIVTPSCRQVGHHRLQSKLLFAISCCAAASSAGSTTASAETASNDSGCATASATATFATATASGTG